MNSNFDLNARVQQLERSNKRMKVLGESALGLALMSFAAPVVCDVVTGERLVLRDENNRTRVTIDAYRTETPALKFQAASGRTTGVLTVSNDGIASLTTYDASGKERGTWRWGEEVKTPTLPQGKADTVSMAR
jgi:hypothetical protein